MLNMKRYITCLFIFVILLLSSLTTAISAASPGEPLGWVLSTDISARIDNWTIESYNINGNTYIIVEDLVEYGFDVIWDGTSKTLRISDTRTALPDDYSPSKRFPPKSNAVGKRMMQYLYTDIKTYIGDTEVMSYNIGGMTCICVDDLAAHFASRYEWQPDRRLLMLWSDTENCMRYPFSADAHTFESTTVTKMPTYLTEGEAVGLCTKCGMTVYHTIDKKGHIYNWKEYNSTNVFLDEDGGSDGGSAVCISDSKPNVLGMVTYYKVEPDTAYVVELDIRTENVKDHEGGAYPLGACVGVGDYNNSGGVTGTTDWTTQRVVGRSDKDGYLYVNYSLGYWNNACTGTAWFENIRITKLDDYKSEDDHVWNFLFVIASELELNFYDEYRDRNVKLNSTIDEKRISLIKEQAEQFEKVLSKASQGRIIPNVHIVVTPLRPERADCLGDTDYWLSGGNVKPDLDALGYDITSYDHVVVVADTGDMPSGSYWGLGGTFIQNYTGYTFIRSFGTAEKDGAGMNYGVMWHEFMHSLETRANWWGYDFPALHDMEQYPYKDDPGDDWNTDYTNGTIRNCKRDYAGLPPVMWELKPTGMN